MTAERWEQIKDLFEAALERDVSVRAAFLDEACTGDPSLRAELDELLASHDRAGRFMASAAFEPAMTQLSEDRPDSVTDCQIGAYRIIREIGRGGMGTVYLAARADEAYRKQVAIKVLKRGMDSDAIVRSFRKERQILASLDHPNIARLHDGGTTGAGLPYFVMDYVEGLPLDVYCDTHQLSITARLELFRVVCSAVDDAHQHGIVHRDLKPGNIVVTVAGVPTLVDFGIAKVLDPELWSATMATTFGSPLTPAYASPEQVRGDEITRASDIYSLGVMLYELLTGHRPYRLHGHTRQEIERVICEQVPEKLSTIVTRREEVPIGDEGRHTTVTPAAVSEARGDRPDRLRQRLTGDLDNIVLTALRKEPERRYATVDQFSEDLRRHLERRPIVARKSTPIYRAAKFVERNRSSLIPVALSSAIILALTAFTLDSYLKGTGAAGRSADALGRLSAKAGQVRSVAILPFQPLVTDTPDESVESGITGALIEKLSKVHQLAIPPAGAVQKYGGSGQNPLAAGRELRVDALLVGKVKRDGDRIRMSVQLIDALDGATMWSETFDEPWTEIFAIQDSISTQVARAAAVRLTGAERQQLAKRDTDNPAAYREYLKGRHFWSQRTSVALKQGLQHFERAIELDPRYASAYGGVADSYIGFATWRVLEPNVAYVKARDVAIKALQLNPALSEPHSVLAMVSLYFDWDWPAAEAEFKRAIALNPSDATAHLRYALALPWFGRFDEALREIARAREVDPVSPLLSANEGQILYLARRYDQAIAHFRRAGASEPTFFANYQTLGSVYIQTGAFDDGIAAYKKAIDLGASSQLQADLAHAYAVSGQTARARKILDELIARATRNYMSAFDIARVYVGLHDHDQAFAWLEKAYHERTRPMLSIRIDPRLDPLRSDPRLDALTRRMKIFEANSSGSTTPPS
jgi:serine/threonine protein kinase/tetratricopeptide (TPR) repeat protein